MNTKTTGQVKINRSSTVEHFFMLSIILFVFWIILSGHLDVKHLLIGSVTSFTVTWITLPLLRLPSATAGDDYFLAFDLPYVKYVLYLPWLLWEVVKANIDVALLILNPKMPIEPQFVTFRKEMSHPFAHVTLANSITLTPGTITVELQDNLYVIHAISGKAAQGLVSAGGEGVMIKKVARIFKEQRGTE